mmetsp:Transcript_122499/g.381334  ORF Transcript_122499/g.381334 Transcript_122499/m.381334 type:complete len:133 (-) Transcript_122499:164-562(-)
MKAVLALLLAASARAALHSARGEQDPCAGCNEELAQAYQACARDHGDPCAETNTAKIVSSAAGTKKDVGCCMKKEKHDRCLQCKSMDCQYSTCNVNKNYYSEHATTQEAKTRTKAAYEKFDAKAMKAAGWGS